MDPLHEIEELNTEIMMAEAAIQANSLERIQLGGQRRRHETLCKILTQTRVLLHDVPELLSEEISIRFRLLSFEEQLRRTIAREEELERRSESLVRDLSRSKSMLPEVLERAKSALERV